MRPKGGDGAGGMPASAAGQGMPFLETGTEAGAVWRDVV